MTKPIPILAAAGAVVLAIALLHHYDARQLRDMRAEMASVRREAERPAPPPVITVEREISVATAAPTATSAPVVAPAAEPSSPAPPPRDARAVRDDLEATFTTESVDRAWSATARNTLQSKLRAAMPSGSSVRTVDCRESMCRIETEHADYESIARFNNSAFMNPATRVWGAAGMSYTEPPARAGEPLRAIAFLAREGTALDVGK